MSVLQAALSQISLAALFAGIIILALAARIPHRWLALLAPLPAALLYLWNPNLRVYSTHGFAHVSVVYEFLNGHFPPECSIMGGKPLLYFWGHHLLIAALSWTLHMSPFTAFALVNTVALGAAALLLYRVGRILGAGPVAGVFSAVLGVYGGAIPRYGFLFKPLDLLTGLTVHDLRSPIPVQKFTNLNSMGVGFAFFALFLYAAVRIFSDERPTWRAYGTLGLSVLGAGFFYPLAWLAIVPCCAVAAGLVLLQSRGAAWPRILRTAISGAIATLLLVPYFYEIGHQKRAALVELVPDPGFAATKLVFLLLLVSLAVLVCLWQREALRRAFERRPQAFLVLLASAVTGGIMFVVIQMWNLNEYKFLMVSTSCTGMLAALGLEELFRRSKLLTFALLCVFQVTFAADFLSKADRSNYPILDPYVEDGALLHHGDPAEEILYRWISHNTNTEAIFVDSKLVVPVFGRRELYIGLTGPKRPGPDDPLNGWSMTAKEMLEEWFGYAPEEIVERTRVARALLEPEGELPADAVRELRETTGERDVYVVSRDAEERRRLARSPDFRPVFEGNRASVFQLLKPGPPEGGASTS